MNARAIGAIIRKDLKVVSQNKGVMLTIIVPILILFVVLPWIVTLVPYLDEILGMTTNDLDDTQQLINRMSPAIQQEFAAYNQEQTFTVYFLVYIMASMFLIIPLSVSSVIAADSFAGEKERKTMEALLYTPTTDRELFIGKLLSGWLAVIVIALVGFALYVVMANAAAWSQMGRIFFPTKMWLVLIFWMVPALPGLGLGVMVLVSSRAQGFQDASQIGSIVVLPVVFLLAGQISGAMSLSVSVMFLLGLGVWLLDGLLIWLGSRTFRRGRLMGA
jgi:ABC-type Na+ efflux pump permease subunit